MKERDERKIEDIAIIRLEGICPFPIEDIRNALKLFPKASSMFKKMHLTLLGCQKVPSLWLYH